MKNFIKQLKASIDSSNSLLNESIKLSREQTQKLNRLIFLSEAMITRHQYSTPNLIISKLYDETLAQIASATPDIPLLHGYKIFSQCDEDGIINYILKKISMVSDLTRTFIEFGSGDGVENNTSALLLEGYRGVWIDGNEANINKIVTAIGQTEMVKVINSFITLDNLDSVLDSSLKFLKTSEIDFLSLDLDGNDYHFIKHILLNIKPKLICVEYNAKFKPPTIQFMNYNPNHAWTGGDYYGASLQAWVELLTDYTLVSCNIDGVNAFFVNEIYAELFPK